jgi:hypothetical protein
VEHKNSNNTWQVTLEWDGEDAILPLPQEVLDHLDAKEGDVLQWIDNGDGTFGLVKSQYDSDSGLTESF